MILFESVEGDKEMDKQEFRVFRYSIVVTFSLILSLAFANTFTNNFSDLNNLLPEINNKAEVFCEEDETAPLKKDMDPNSETIALLGGGDKINLIEGRVNWFYVETSDNIRGYLDNRYVKTNYLPPVKFKKSMKNRIIVSQKRQKLYIIKDSRIEKEFIVSTGLENTQTPNGLFIIEPGMRGTWFFSNKYSQGGKFWIGFRGNYLFHSVPMDRNKNIIPEELAKIGQPASHGCIRLFIEDAEWLYNNIKDGTPILIRP